MNKKHVFLLLFCALFFAFQYGIKSAIPNVLNENLRSYFSANASQIGFLFSLSFLAYTAMQIPTGLIIDRVSVKKIVISSFAFFSLGLIAFVISPNYFCAAISQISLGVTSSFALILIMKVTNDYFPREKVAIISGLAMSAGGLGPVICNPLMAHLTLSFQWQNVVICSGFLGILCAAVVLFMIKEQDLIQPNTKSDLRSVIRDIKTVISDSRYIKISIFSMTIWGACSSFCDAWGVPFLTCAHGISREEAAYAISFAYTGMILGSPLSAFLAETFNNYKKVMLGEAFCFLVSLGIISFTHISNIPLRIILFAMGTFAMSQFLAFPLVLSLCDKKLSATVTGIVNTISMLGCTILVSVIGYVLDWSKGTNLTYSAADYRCSMIASVFSVLVGIMILALLKIPNPKNYKN
jgi:MFS family permease